MSKLSKKRKITYYIGKGMMVLGFIIFFSQFFTFSFGVPFIFAPIGMLFMIAGTFISNIGAKGLAGSGLKLDPDEAREDLKPFNEARGKMINDIVSGIDAVDSITKSQQSGQAPREVIKIRCRSCNCLNDEDAKFCKNCGAPF